MKSALIALLVSTGVVGYAAHVGWQYPMRQPLRQPLLAAGFGHAPVYPGMPLRLRGAGSRMVGRGCCHGPNCH